MTDSVIACLVKRKIFQHDRLLSDILVGVGDLLDFKPVRC
jgi:hypothetical protein